MEISRAYPVYTVGESGTLYANQGQYYATNTGTSGTATAVGYSTTGAHYLVQQAVDADTLIASTRNSPQTTSAVSCNIWLYILLIVDLSGKKKLTVEQK